MKGQFWTETYCDLTNDLSGQNYQRFYQSTFFDNTNHSSVRVNETVTYKCEAGMKQAVPEETTEFVVTCLDNFTYSYPNPVPDCLSTMYCTSASPPEVPVAGVEYNFSTSLSYLAGSDYIE